MAPRQPRRSVLVFSLVSTVLLFGLSSIASAQGAPGFHLGISGGADFPVEDQDQVFNTGWNGTLMLNWNFGTSPFGLRLDGSYHDMKIKDELLVFFNEGDVRIIDGTFNFVLGPHFGAFQPYIFGGVGAYSVRFHGQVIDADDFFTDRVTKFGWNAGTGFAFCVGSTTHFFVEGRYTNIDLDGNRFTDAITTEGRRFTMVSVNTGVVF